MGRNPTLRPFSREQMEKRVARAYRATSWVLETEKKVGRESVTSIRAMGPGRT